MAASQDMGHIHPALLTLVTALLLAPSVASRPVNSTATAAAASSGGRATSAEPKAIDGKPEIKRSTQDGAVSVAGCGFLWLFKCDTLRVTIHCRCIRGCRFNFNKYLGFDAPDGRYCSNGAYNYGAYCPGRHTLGFDKKATWTVVNRSFSIGGRTINPNAYWSTYNYRLPC